MRLAAELNGTGLPLSTEERGWDEESVEAPGRSPVPMELESLDSLSGAVCGVGGAGGLGSDEDEEPDACNDVGWSEAEVLPGKLSSISTGRSGTSASSSRITSATFAA